MRRIMCVRMQSWPTDRIRHRRPSLRDKPLALIDTGRRALVMSVSNIARTTGIRPGMTSAEAAALCGNLKGGPMHRGRICADLRRLQDRTERTIEPIFLKLPQDLRSSEERLGIRPPAAFSGTGRTNDGDRRQKEFDTPAYWHRLQQRLVTDGKWVSEPVGIDLTNLKPPSRSVKLPALIDAYPSKMTLGLSMAKPTGSSPGTCRNFYTFRLDREVPGNSRSGVPAVQ